MKRLAAWVLALALVLISTGAGASDIREEQVTFPAGTSATTLKAAIAGGQAVAYHLGAEAGQVLEVKLAATNPAAYFNVYQPGKRPGEQALAASGLTGPMVPELNRFSGKLPLSGEYTILVYMMRSAARRDEGCDYALAISLSGAGPVASRPPVRADFADGLQGGPDYWRVSLKNPGTTLALRAEPSAGAAFAVKAVDGAILRNLGCRMVEARRWCKVETTGPARITAWTVGDFLRESAPPEGQEAPTSGPAPAPTPAPAPEFQATGKLPCARYAGQAMSGCDFGVRREGGGNAAVTVFWPDGGTRVLLFKDGNPASYERTEGDGDAELTFQRNADLFILTIDRERFEIPEAVINGG